MFFGKKSVFTRAIAAITIPFLLVFLLLVYLGRDVVRQASEHFAREMVRSRAQQVSMRIEDRLAVMYTALNMARRVLADLDGDGQDAEEQADRMLRNMLLSAEGVNGAWFAFEPGAFPRKGRYIKSYVKRGRSLIGIGNVTNDLLDNPEASPWYNFPLRSGSNYFLVADQHDYGIGEGPVYRGALTFPVKRRGVVVGCVGMDILYRQFLNFLDNVEVMDGKRANALITDAREVIYASGPDGEQRVLATADEVARALADREPVVGYHSVPGGEGSVFTVLAPIPVARSSVHPLLYIEIPPEALLAGSGPMVRRAVIVVVVCFLLLGTAIYFLLRGVVGPIRAMTGKAEAIAAGNLLVDFGADAGDGSANEVELMQAALKKMMEQLAEAHGLKLAAVRADYERNKVKAANEAKSRFFATMSHEMRTPMNAIIGLSEMLLGRGLQGVELSHVQDINMSAVSLLRIINDILDASKMEAGRFELAPRHYDFRALLDNVRSVARLMAAKKGLRFVHSGDDGLPQCLYGDAERVRQILLNLVSNAVKYTDAGGVDFDARLDGDFIVFSVRDTGVGIRAEDLPLVFEPYRQAGAGKSGEVEGTGLGLGIARQLAELMEGSITASSVLGEGSEFVVRLPCVPGDPKKIASRDSARTGARWNARVLVVDDNRVNLKVAEGLLRMHGITPDLAGSGREALEKIRETEYALVFMDHMMPEMDGVETPRAIRAMGGRLATIPIVALTANAMAETRDFLINEGLNDFLAKPIEMPKLRAVLARWLSGSKA